MPIVQDNVRMHCTPGARAVVRKLRLQVTTIPGYSPSTNVIEILLGICRKMLDSWQGAKPAKNAAETLARFREA